MRSRTLRWTVLLAAVSAVSFAQDPNGERQPIQSPIVRAVNAAGPAVVNISTEKIVATQTPDPMRRQLFDEDRLDEYFDRFQQMNVRKRSLGSGVLFDPRGYIVTNEHVVHRASKIEVTLKDRSTYSGRLISTDHTRDLAVIKISRPRSFPVAALNRREPLMIGETAIAVGNPFGFEHTVTVGVVSAVDRNVRVKGQVVMQNLIQTDASINPGNSGGALLDINGDLIGINTAVRSGAEGIGFAIPVTELRQALVDLLDFRRLSKVWIGLGLVGLVNRNTNEPVGLRVMRIQPGSPAEKAELKYGDIITRLNGKKCIEVLAFEIDVLEAEVGRQLVFEGYREGKPLKVTVTLAQIPMPDPNVVIAGRLGLKVEEPSRADALRLGIDPNGGVVVTAVAQNSPAAAAAVKVGDVITLFANFRVADPETLATGLARVASGEQVRVLIIREGAKYLTWIRVK